MSKGKKKRFRLAVLGLILLGLWGMLALLLGASVGMETHYRANLKADLQPGFGETHATPHPLDEAAGRSRHKDLPPLCLGMDCLGTEEVVSTASLDEPVDDGADDATSSIGRPRSPQGSPGTSPFNIAQSGPPDFFPNGLFIPGGLPGGNPNPGRPENPSGGNPNPPDNFAPRNPGDTPPPDFTPPPFLNLPGPDSAGPTGPGPNGPGPNGPASNGPGPDGPGSGGPDQPLQIPEPLTLSLFVAGVVGSVLLRRRNPHSSK